MKRSSVLSALVAFSIWINLFAPFIHAQIEDDEKNQESEKRGLVFNITEIPTNAAQKIAAPLPETENLSPAETEGILRRLPILEKDAAEKADFKFAPSSLLPPKTGKIIPIDFAPTESAKTPTEAQKPLNLEVLQFSPAGEVPMASEITITFSQPMIAVAAQAEANANVPVVMSPQVKGSWRWAGANTLIFKGEPRLPAATEFTITIPEGTKSVTGGILGKAVTRKFSTAPPTAEIVLPAEKVIKRDQLFFFNFNQKINPQDVLVKTRIAVNEQTLRVRAATNEEIAADKNLSTLMKTLRENEFVIFRAVDLLPNDAAVKVSFNAALPSAEGNLTTKTEQTFEFKTFSKFQILKAKCYSETSICEPSETWNIEFNNSIDKENFPASLIKIEPEIKDLDFSIYDKTLTIIGSKPPRREFKLTISKDLKDRFGQTLGEDVSVRFITGAEEPVIFNEGEQVVTLDPNAKPIYQINSLNYPRLEVSLYSVNPSDFPAFWRFSESDDKSAAVNFGKLLYQKTIKTEAAPDEYAQSSIDISQALKNNFGHAVLIIQPVGAAQSEKVIKWLQATQIGIDALADNENLTAFATTLKEGKPLADVRISINGKSAAATNSQGLATLKLPVSEADDEDSPPQFLIAKNGSDTAILPKVDSYQDDNNWTALPQKDGLRWFVFDDRKIYRPNETVSVKGYLRKVLSGKFAEISELGNFPDSISYVLKDASEAEIAKGTAKINAFGAFNLELKLPENINLGDQELKFTAASDFEDKEFTHHFRVEEFRRPEFQVAAKVDSAAPFYLGDSAKISAKAEYFSGGGLSDANVKWYISSLPASYTPPNRDDFTFGTWTPWWEDNYGGDWHLTSYREFKGETDADGNHALNLDFISTKAARPFSISAQATVEDVNRQAFSGTTNLLVHPSRLYVGLRSAKTFVQPNQKFKVETITTDIDGNAVTDAVVFVKAELRDWQQIKGEWQNIVIDTQICNFKSQSDVSACEFTAPKGGVYQITARVLDERERPNESEITVWAAGGSSQPKDRIEEETLTLIPDKKEYKPNETAEILVNSPFYPAEAVMTLDKNGIFKTERFAINSASTIVKIPIEEKYLPNFHVRIETVGAVSRVLYADERDAKLLNRPAFASGELQLNVSTKSRTLQVTAEPADKILKPAEQTKINLAVRDAEGKPVANSEIALVAVDESILALTDYKIQNPIDEFYKEIEAKVSSTRSRESVLLIRPNEMVGYGSGSGMGSGDGGGGGGAMTMMAAVDKSPPEGSFAKYDGAVKEPIKIRRNFAALAIFAPSVKTDKNGKAAVELKLPDNLTRYRITAIAATKSKEFGLGESSLTARQPITIRASAPRFLNFGDTAELPIVVQNQTDKPQTVSIAIRAANAEFTEGNGKRLTIPANDRAEIRFPVKSEKAGVARFQVAAVSEDFADAAEFSLPVYTPATSETFATYGTTDEDGAIIQPVSAPKDVYPQFGGLEITTSSTQLQELTDAFIYLQNYPYECNEQIASRVISTVALRDVLRAFEAKDLPTNEQIAAKMKSDVEKLQRLQHADGGFSFWRSDDESFPYVSAHVAHALARLKQKDYAVPQQVISKSLSYLKTIEANRLFKLHSQASQNAVSAYALYVRNLLGDKDAAKARKLLRENTQENLSVETLGWLLSVLANDADSAAEVENIKQNLINRASVTADKAHFTIDYTDGEYVILSSERRADGIVLESLLEADAKNPLIPKIVRGLLASKTKGRWKNTQENALILLALDKYFHVYETVTPNFAARIWLGNSFAGEQNFRGRSVNSNLVNVPMNYLQSKSETQNLVLNKQGAGRIYYRIGMQYAPKDLNLKAADFGFAVTRSYQGVDNPEDAKLNADGSWNLKAGAKIRVVVQMVAPSVRHHVALVDYLPAGVEIINTNLANSSANQINLQKSPLLPNYYGTWFDRENLRDNRAEAFKSYLYAGIWTYTYLVRATAPGNFVAPPAKAEEMYSPETFGRSKTDFVKIR